jgi:hypothetical protein
VSWLKNKYLWLGLLAGIVATLLFLYRRQLSDLWNNRRTISDGAKVAGGTADVLDGLKGLWAGWTS